MANQPMNEERRKKIEELMKNADPEMIEKYGNPLDENDPRVWTPTKRQEEGMSDEERLRLLELDLEAQSGLIAHLTQLVFQHEEYIREKMMEDLKEKFLKEMQDNPENAVKNLMNTLGANLPKGSYGPLEDSPDTPIRYAGSVDDTIKPDDLVETPQGPIRADQIPGYSPLPGWKPSPDWAEANCMCPAHQAARAESEGRRPDDEFGTGFYL